LQTSEINGETKTNAGNDSTTESSGKENSAPDKEFENLTRNQYGETGIKLNLL
jgi:hypothetical protein